MYRYTVEQMRDYRAELAAQPIWKETYRIPFSANRKSTICASVSVAVALSVHAWAIPR